MRIYAMADTKIMNPEGTAQDIGDRTWLEIGEIMLKGGASHVCILADTRSPGGGGCLMPMGMMTLEEYMIQASRLG